MFSLSGSPRKHAVANMIQFSVSLSLSSPEDVTILDDGTLLVCSHYTNSVLKFNSTTGKTMWQTLLYMNSCFILLRFYFLVVLYLYPYQGRIQEKMWPVSKRVSTEGASWLGGSGGMLPRKILKILLSKTLFPAFSGLKINLGWEHGLKIKCSFHSPLLRCVQVPFSGDGVLQILQLPHPHHVFEFRFAQMQVQVSPNLHTG